MLGLLFSGVILRTLSVEILASIVHGRDVSIFRLDARSITSKETVILKDARFMTCISFKAYILF